MITDYYGTLHYADRIDLVVIKYLQILKKSGAIYTNLGNLEFTFVLEGGEEIPFSGWLDSIPGVTVIGSSREVSGRTSFKSFRITKTVDLPQVPELELFSVGRSGKSLKRVFTVVRK